MNRIASLGFVLLLAAAGCTDGTNLGSEALGTRGNPPKNDGSCDQGLVVCGGICTDVSDDAKNCGACGAVCAMNGACAKGVCDNACGSEGKACCAATDAGDGCSNGLTCENGTCQKPNQCGNCTAPNATTGCVMGACAIQSCNQGFGDCDANYANGCETNLLTDANNCGACGQACQNGACVNGVCMGNNMCGPCNLAHATSACNNNVCSIASCDAGYADCDADPKDGCEVATASDGNNCGACGKVCANGTTCMNGQCVANNNCGMCAAPNAKAACAMGACVIAQCNQGFADCDQLYADGCETNVSSDPNNCGACGQVCGGQKMCVNGLCN